MKLDVEKVMSEVRNQVSRRRGAFGSAPDTAPGDAANEFPYWMPTTAPIAIKSSYTLSELLVYSDRAFLEAAYLAILRRLPDVEGMATFLSRLRAGELTKVEVLAALRWSEEGVARSIHVDGLLAPYLIGKWRRKRFIGPLLAWATTFLRLDAYVERMRRAEAAQAAETYELGQVMNTLSQHVQTKLMRMEQAEHGRAVESGKQVEDLKAQVAAQAQEIMRLTNLPKERLEAERRLDDMYVEFEKVFRGSEVLIRERMLPYIDIVRSAGAGTPEAPVIDLGCGRGDWLGLLREHGLTARGIDSNRVFLSQCAERGLDVIEGDVMEALREMPDGSVGAITAIHVAEHLPFDVLVAMLDECRRVLRAGGVLALETPNPENLQVAMHNFYIDPTHRNPLPPVALRWIVEARGFDGARIQRWTVARELGAPALLAPEVPGAASVNKLLSQLHAAADYAIIARRPQ